MDQKSPIQEAKMILTLLRKEPRGTMIPIYSYTLLSWVLGKSDGGFQFGYHRPNASVLNTYPNLEWIDTPQPGCLLDFCRYG